MGRHPVSVSTSSAHYVQFTIPRLDRNATPLPQPLGATSIPFRQRVRPAQDQVSITLRFIFP